jgi:hypothetical protein
VVLVSATPYDPLRLCVYATIALLTWILGPIAVVGFAVLGFVGYWRARRAGLTRSKCALRDTRLVLGYLAAVAVAGIAGVVWQLVT